MNNVDSVYPVDKNKHNEESPRTSNRGAERTEQPAMRSLVDWLQVTFKSVQDLKEIVHFLRLSEVDFIETKGQFGYPVCYRWQHIALFTDYNDVHVQFTGQGCREYEELEGSIPWDELFRAIKHYYEDRYSVARIDVAIDDFTPHFKIKQLHQCLKRGHVKSRMKRAKNIEDIEIKTGEVKGQTLYFGQPSSRIQIRFYEKHEERLSKGYELEEGIEFWNRSEIQARNERAETIFTLISVGEDDGGLRLGEIIKGILTNYVNFLKPSKSDSNKRRWHTTKWWETFIDGVEALSLSTLAPDVTLERKENWIDNQVDKTLSIIYHAYDGDLDKIKEKIINGTDKLKKQDVALIDDFKNRQKKNPRKDSDN